MSPNHRRFWRGLVLAECTSCSLDCAQYSEWENRSKSWWSWDNHGKQITLSLHRSQSYAEEFSSIGLSNCYGEISHLFSVLQCELQQRKRQTMFYVSSALTGHTFSSTQDTILQFKRGIFSFLTLTWSPTLFPRPWLSWYQLNTLHVSSHWSIGWK